MSFLKKKPRKILQDADVLRLRDLEAKGQLNTREAAQLYGVGTETIRRAVRGDTFTKLGAGKTEADLERAAAESLERVQQLIAQGKVKLTRGNTLLDELDEGGKDGGEL